MNWEGRHNQECRIRSSGLNTQSDSVKCTRQRGNRQQLRVQSERDLNFCVPRTPSLRQSPSEYLPAAVHKCLCRVETSFLLHHSLSVTIETVFCFSVNSAEQAKRNTVGFFLFFLFFLFSFLFFFYQSLCLSPCLCLSVSVSLKVVKANEQLFGSVRGSG